MPVEKIEITFNKDFMTAKELKQATGTLESIFDAFDRWAKTDPQRFAGIVAQHRDSFKIGR